MVNKMKYIYPIIFFSMGSLIILYRNLISKKISDFIARIKSTNSSEPAIRPGFICAYGCVVIFLSIIILYINL